MTGGKRTRKAGKGGRKTRKLSPKLKAWNQKVMAVFREMRAKDKGVSFRAALVEAGKRRKAGKI